jgi:hypothetical protein
MLSYPIDEAEQLLTTKLTTAKKSFANCEEDLDFLREQITVRHSEILVTLEANGTLQTMEVATARVYNWEVVQKRKEKEEAEKNKSSGEEKDEPTKD